MAVEIRTLKKVYPITGTKTVVTQMILPNTKEAQGITGCRSPGKAAMTLLSYGPDVVKIKLGPEGCLVANGDEIIRVPGFKCDAFDATGAGDAFNAGFMLGF